MRKKDTVPEHPLRAAQRENVALEDEVKFLHEALHRDFGSRVLRGIPGHLACGWVAVTGGDKDVADFFN